MMTCPFWMITWFTTYWKNIPQKGVDASDSCMSRQHQFSIPAMLQREGPRFPGKCLLQVEEKGPRTQTKEPWEPGDKKACSRVEGWRLLTSYGDLDKSSGGDDDGWMDDVHATFPVWLSPPSVRLNPWGTCLKTQPCHTTLCCSYAMIIPSYTKLCHDFTSYTKKLS